MCRGKLHLALLLVASLFVACDEEGPNDGDCSARIGWEGTTYRSHNELNQKAPRAEQLGTGEVLDCDGSAVASVEVFAVEGVATWPKELRTR